MANSISARKRVRQNADARARNRWRLRTLRHSIRGFEEKLQHGSAEEAQQAFREAARLLDKTAGKGVIHKNTAARRKSRLNARLKARATAG